MNIVLAHGVLGAHIFAGKPYFNGVAEHLRGVFHANVLETESKPIGVVKKRAQQMREQIRHHFGAAPADKLIIIAHSMGGLDTRQMLKDDAGLANHVRSLTCIATPHRGSPVATLLNAANPLRFFGSFAEDVNAVDDLSEKGASAIDESCPDHPTIRYREVVGIGRLGEQRTAKFFEVTSLAIDEDNDGVVPMSSALPPGRTLLEVAHADHADLVGHDVDDAPRFRARAFNHLPLYERIVRAAIA